MIEGFEELVPKLAKSVGFGTGLELRESRLQLTATNATPVAAKMVFNVSVGVQDLSNPDATDEKDKKFAIQVCCRLISGHHHSSVESSRSDCASLCPSNSTINSNVVCDVEDGTCIS